MAEEPRPETVSIEFKGILHIVEPGKHLKIRIYSSMEEALAFGVNPEVIEPHLISEDLQPSADCHRSFDWDTTTNPWTYWVRCRPEKGCSKCNVIGADDYEPYKDLNTPDYDRTHNHDYKWYMCRCVSAPA